MGLSIFENFKAKNTPKVKYYPTGYITSPFEENLTTVAGCQIVQVNGVIRITVMVERIGLYFEFAATFSVNKVVIRRKIQFLLRYWQRFFSYR